MEVGWGVVFFVLVAVVHCFATAHVWYVGSRHYDAGTCAIYDVGHHALPDLSEVTEWKHVLLLPILVPLVLHRTSVNVPSVLFKVGVLLLVRAVSMMGTILPRRTDRRVDKLTPWSLTMGGTWYDRMFSGHVAIGCLLTWELFRNGIVGCTWLPVLGYAALNIANGVVAVATRSHYTMDVVMAVWMAMLVIRTTEN